MCSDNFEYPDDDEADTILVEWSSMPVGVKSDANEVGDWAILCGWTCGVKGPGDVHTVRITTVAHCDSWMLEQGNEGCLYDLERVNNTHLASIVAVILVVVLAVIALVLGGALILVAQVVAAAVIVVSMWGSQCDGSNSDGGNGDFKEIWMCFDSINPCNDDRGS